MRTIAITLALTVLVGCSDELSAPDAGGETPDAESEIDATPPRVDAGPQEDAPNAPTIDASPDAGTETDAGEAGIGGPAPSADAGWYLTTARCPRELLPASSGTVGSSSVPQHPMTYVEVIKGAALVQTDALKARWTAAKTQATPVVRACLPAFVSTPAGPPCTVDSVIEFTTTAGANIEIVIGLPHADLARFADGREVSLRLGPPITAPDGSPSRSIEIREPSGLLLVAVHASEERTQSLAGFRWDDLELGFGARDCATARDFCLRVFVSRKLAVTSAGATQELDPGQSSEVRSQQRNYRVTHRRAVERAYGVFDGAECADLSAVTASVELVQLP